MIPNSFFIDVEFLTLVGLYGICGWHANIYESILGVTSRWFNLLCNNILHMWTLSCHYNLLLWHFFSKLSSIYTIITHFHINYYSVICHLYSLLCHFSANLYHFLLKSFIIIVNSLCYISLILLYMSLLLHLYYYWHISYHFGLSHVILYKFVSCHYNGLTWHFF